MKKCNCNFCKNYDKYRWAIITECPCACHTCEEISGHDGLCCEFPNGKRKDNPYKKLKPAAFYKKIIQDWQRECDI